MLKSQAGYRSYIYLFLQFMKRVYQDFRYDNTMLFTTSMSRRYSPITISHSGAIDLLASKADLSKKRNEINYPNCELDKWSLSIK